MQTDTDPYVQFNKPFQSGEGMCYPIYPWNYYNIKTGGSSKSSSKRNIKKGGSNCPDFKNVDINTKKYFGPFLYPPVPFNTQNGGKRKYNKKGGSNNKYLTGPEYLNQPLVPTTPSSVSDLQYNGSFTDTNPEWKQALTGYRLPPAKNNIDISKNYGVTYATAMGGKPKKSTAKKQTKKRTTKKTISKKASTKKTTTKKPTTKKASTKKTTTKKPITKKVSSKRKTSKKQKGGATFLPAQFYNPNAKLSTGPGCTTSAYGDINAVSGPCRNLAPCPNSSGIQTGGKNKRKNNKKGGSSGMINTFYTKTANNSGNIPGYDSYMLDNINKYAKYNGGSNKKNSNGNDKNHQKKKNSNTKNSKNTKNPNRKTVKKH